MVDPVIKKPVCLFDGVLVTRHFLGPKLSTKETISPMSHNRSGKLAAAADDKRTDELIRAKLYQVACWGLRHFSFPTIWQRGTELPGPE